MAVIKLYNGDCLDVMNVIQDKSVDLILCDLPYGTQKSNGCKWDVVIPFERLWEQYERVITNVGAIVLFGKEPFSSLLRCSKLELYKYDWIWNKDTKSNFMLADHQPLNNVETISVFSKAYARHIENKPMMTYNPQFTDGERYNIPKETKQTGIFKMNDSKDATYKHKERDTSKRYRIEKSNKMKLSVFLSCFNLPLLFRSVQTVIHSWAVHKREFGSTATYLNILSWFYSHKQCIS